MTGKLQIIRFFNDRENAAVAEFGTMLPRVAVGQWHLGHALAVELDEFADDADGHTTSVAVTPGWISETHDPRISIDTG